MGHHVLAAQLSHPPHDPLWPPKPSVVVSSDKLSKITDNLQIGDVHLLELSMSPASLQHIAASSCSLHVAKYLCKANLGFDLRSRPGSRIFFQLTLAISARKVKQCFAPEL